MASKTFTLGEEKKGFCVKTLLALIMIGVVTTAVIVGYYVFKSASDGGFSGCRPPALDLNGLSNWTVGAEVIALGCFGDHSIQGNKISISKCVDNKWIPEIPACVALPLHLICSINKDGLYGTIHMLQLRKEDPLQIYGNLSTLEIDRTKGLFSEVLPLSRTTCFSSDDFNISASQNSFGLNHSHDFIEIMFKTQSLVAYKKVELRVIMVFIDLQNTATLVSCSQEDVVVVMAKPVTETGPSTDWTWDKNNVTADSLI